MTEVQPNEDPLLKPLFLKIFEGFRQREEARVALGSHSTAEYRPGAEGAPEVESLVNKVSSAELELLRDLVGLFAQVETALRDSGEGPGKLAVVTHFKPYQIAFLLIGEATFVRRYALVSRSPENGDPEFIHDVIFTTETDRRSWRQIDLVYDLLQYWELFLRHQTPLRCTAFCNGCRRYLLPRVSTSIFRDAISKLCPATSNVTSKSDATRVALRMDIERRLDKIARRLTEQESKKKAIQEFTAGNMNPSSPMHTDLNRARLLYSDELSLILSELVHLHDNVAKLLKANRVSKHQLDIVEKMNPYRVASCFVNTEKHGIRGKTKTAAFDLFSEFLHQRDGVPSEMDQIVDLIPIINYDGQAWQAPDLIEDLLQLWELFLRNHTDVDTSRVSDRIGKTVGRQKRPGHLLRANARRN